MSYFSCRRNVLFIALMTFSNLLFAHGGVSMEDDMCFIKVGEYKAHFTGYQPKLRATQEFCEDIPEVSNAIFVIDFMDKALRHIPVSFRIIKDANQIGNNAKLEDLGGEKGIEEATLYYSEPALYPTGTLNFPYEFSEEGKYIGIFTLHPEDGAEAVNSVFPFSVGIKNYTGYYIRIALVVLITLLGYWLSSKFYGKKDKSKK